MKRLLFALALILIFSSCSKIDSGLYIIALREYPTIEGGIMWVLDYSLDGAVYSPAFTTREEVVQYYAWLRRGRKIEGGPLDGY